MKTAKVLRNQFLGLRGMSHITKLQNKIYPLLYLKGDCNVFSYSNLISLAKKIYLEKSETQDEMPS